MSVSQNNILTGKYLQFHGAIDSVIDGERIITDPLKTLAYGTDASFYRLVPKIVIKADDEEEVSYILKTASRCQIPVTFRAAGTSLSGQAITDSVLVIAGERWQEYQVLGGGERIRLQPGIIGKFANTCLTPFGKKIGPDPASINAAMIGGIAANNASGMCCGNSQNSYKTLASIRIVFQDGTILDTGCEKSREAFRKSRPEILAGIGKLRDTVEGDRALRDRIDHKFKIKNTTGYSLNALIDFEDPFEVIAHLMIGSEGTLGFISEITYNTVEEHPHKASALILFPSIHEACSATALLAEQPVEAVELMDRAALRSVEEKEGMPSYLRALPDKAAALLVETRASEHCELQRNIDSVILALEGISLERTLEFTQKSEEYSLLWNIRKGLFPAVGAVREAGTTVIIEDVAFPLERLAEATLELQAIMAKHGYDKGIIFGHALAGNLHFVFTQDFSTREEVERYSGFMDEVCSMVVNTYDGSLKAEHGTGRNMAPYVAMEWGQEAYGLMQEIKELFDPEYLLNPGVILNTNPRIHLENLKPLPSTNPIVDKCIECGFCEPTCPSRNLTLTPRQRIAIQREISRLRITNGSPERLESLLREYKYQGDATCATDGLCQSACPVEINTADLTKELRRLRLENTHRETLAKFVSQNFALVTWAIRLGLKAVHLLHSLVGTGPMTTLAKGARQLSGNRLPLWTPHMPKGAKGISQKSSNGESTRWVVYFPSCISRTMGPASVDRVGEELSEVTAKVLSRAGFGVIYPPGMEKLCCGVPFSSKGAFKQADEKCAELEAVLWEITEGGRIPVICDTSPCLYRMREKMDKRLQLFEPAEFIHDHVMEYLQFSKLPEAIALHTTCSSEKMGLASKMRAVAEACAEEVVVPEKVGCCAFAGDRGFTYPELNATALTDLREEVYGCRAGYSNSRTCEIGLSLHGGITYSSILYLVERCTR